MSKKTKQKAITLSPKKIEQIKKDATKEAAGLTTLVFLVATMDVMGEMTEKQVADIYETTNRYANYIDKHLVKLSQVADIIERQTGVRPKIRGLEAAMRRKIGGMK